MGIPPKWRGHAFRDSCILTTPMYGYTWRPDISYALRRQRRTIFEWIFKQWYVLIYSPRNSHWWYYSCSIIIAKFTQNKVAGTYFRIFQIAATQFSSFYTPCKLVEVVFNIYYGVNYGGSKGYCQVIDEALSSDNFPSLRSVQLYGKIPFDYFPALQSRKLLSVCF